MKTQTTRNTALALAGMLALTIYILACTSFSPDDTKVLYPTFDSSSGALGMAVYDREARRSEMLFLPCAYEGGRSNVVGPQFLRGQWLADGRNILVAWTGAKDGDEAVNLALLPWGGRGQFKVFRVTGVKDAEALLLLPVPVAGERVFIRSGPKEVVRVDLKSGALERHEFADAKEEVSLYPDPTGTGVFYAESEAAHDSGGVFGRLNPDNFGRTPLLVITNAVADKSFFAYGKEGTAAAFLEKAEGRSRLVVMRKDKPGFSRSLGTAGDGAEFGSAGFAPRGEMLWATFQRAEGTNSMSYGLMEIPLSEAPVRETILIRGAPPEQDAAMYFQGSMSHDGKAVAVASTYLGFTDKFRPEDCGLFLVDLSDPNRKVTRVPIPLPPNLERGK